MAKVTQMIEVQLIHKGQPQGRWLSVEQMIEDLNSKAVILEPGDHLVVGAAYPISSRPIIDVRKFAAEVIPFKKRG